MMMWNPQDPYHTGALHAFQPNLDDIPIITRKNKQTKPIMASNIQPIMASNILNAPCLKMPNNQQHNDNRRIRSRSPRAHDTNKSRRSRSPSRHRPPRAPSMSRVSPPRERVPPAAEPDYESMLKEQRLKTAAAFLNMYGLEDINTTHSVFKALALFYDVDVGPCTSKLSTRTQALDTLAAAMAEGIEKGMKAPTYADIRTQADEIDKMEMSPTSSAKGNKKTQKINKKLLNDNAIIEIEDNELNPNELKLGKAKKQ